MFLMTLNSAVLKAVLMCAITVLSSWHVVNILCSFELTFGGSLYSSDARRN